MNLTTEDLQRFIGGQLELQNSREGLLIRGEISAATMGTFMRENDTLKIELAWVGKNDGSPHAPSSEWSADPDLGLRYNAVLMMTSVTPIGEGRLFLQTPTLGEVVTLFSKRELESRDGGCTFNRSRIKGLDSPTPQP